MRIVRVVIAVLFAPGFCDGAVAPLTVDQVVELALQVNSQVRSAEARWYSAEHQILPNFVPADPTITYSNVGSPTNGITHPSDVSFGLSQALQFPGKGYLQGQTAKRTAEIARLTYEAAGRDVRAQAETAFYQLLLDQALFDVGTENVATLKQVLQVTQVAYSAGRVTQLDFISAEFTLSAAEQQQMQLAASIATDRANLNQVLQRRPEEPLEIEGRLDLAPIEPRIEALVDAASRARQEILETALAAENGETSLRLAKLEYAPDFTLGFTSDRFQLSSASPDNVHLQTYSVSVGLNLPVFFWFHQKEDVERARFDLEAARSDLSSIRLQTATQVTNVYRQAELAYRTALLYRDSLVPLARQGVNVALVAYQGGKIDFVALSSALEQRNTARVTYLQQTNQFLAERIALEQAIGRPLSQL
jgi:cobalt-zinc-cadmium efflux system outer membrane protein